MQGRRVEELSECQSVGVRLDTSIKTERQTTAITLNFLVAVVNSINTKTHSSKETAEFCFKNADVKSICYCKQRVKSKLSLSSECVETKLCRPGIFVNSHLHSSCGMVWYRILRIKRKHNLSTAWHSRGAEKLEELSEYSLLVGVRIQANTHTAGQTTLLKRAQLFYSLAQQRC